MIMNRVDSTPGMVRSSYMLCHFSIYSAVNFILGPLLNGSSANYYQGTGKGPTTPMHLYYNSLSQLSLLELERTPEAVAVSGIYGRASAGITGLILPGPVKKIPAGIPWTNLLLFDKGRVLPENDLSQRGASTA